MTTELITNEDFWDDPGLLARLRYSKVHSLHGGAQAHLQFVNGYGLSIINGAGLGVEVMVLDAEDGTIARDDLPIEALAWIRGMLADDTVITHLNPTELHDIIFDVAYWPDRNALEEGEHGDRNHE